MLTVGLRLLALCVAIVVTGCGSTPEETAPEPRRPLPERREPVEGPQVPGAPTADQVETNPEEEDPGTLDTVHETVSDRVRGAATWLDSFLGDERFLEEDNRTTVTMRLDTILEERRGLELKPRVNARIVLPRTERRFHLVVGRDDDEQGIDSTQKPDETPGTDDSDVGLQYFLKATARNNIRGEVGLRFNDLTPNPYAGARYRHTLPLGSWVARGYQRMRNYRVEGWESQTTIDFERLLGEGLFFRASTTGSWFEQEPGYYYGQYFSIFHWIEGSGLCTYEWNNSLQTRPSNELKETQLRFRFSRRVFRDWILFEIAPQVTWREEIDYEPALGIMLRLELLFGGRHIQYHSPLQVVPEYEDRFDG